jgi:hypothetical protein
MERTKIFNVKVHMAREIKNNLMADEKILCYKRNQMDRFDGQPIVGNKKKCSRSVVIILLTFLLIYPLMGIIPFTSFVLAFLASDIARDFLSISSFSLNSHELIM